MPTTSNFGWNTPADTDLVKDGAAAIRTLGNNIDASLVDLKGGTTGQVLAKATNTDLDFTWVAQDDSNAIQNAIVDAKGDLITATAADVPARLGVGANGTVLTANSATATGLEWATVSAGGMTLISTATPSAATTVSFTSIPTTYKTLLLVWDTIIQDSENVYFSVRLNNDSNTNYNVVGTNIVGAAGIFQQTNGTSFGNSATNAPIGASPTSTTEANRPRNGFMWIYNADQTTGIKTVSYSSYGWSGAFTDWVGPIMANGRYLGTSAISRIDLIRNGTQTITGTIRLYGVS